jgi:hypothetical protein
MDYKAFNAKKAGNFKGVVLYQPIITKEGKNTVCKAYKIYIVDNKGKFISGLSKKDHFLNNY